MDKFLCCKLSAPSSDKSDITVKMFDISTEYSPAAGFSMGDLNEKEKRTYEQKRKHGEDQK